MKARFSALCLLCLVGTGGSEEPTERLEFTYATLGATPYPAIPLPVPERLEVTRRVHKLIAAKEAGGPKKEAEMQPYELRAPRVKAHSLKMLVIPGGKFVFGSERKGEGPPRKVRIESFWMSEIEIPWAFYRPYCDNFQSRRKDGSLSLRRSTKRTRSHATNLPNGDPKSIVDVISQPTPQYFDLFLGGYLDEGLGYPAMCVTHHAASKFCQWLSAQTGEFYRLPTEAEWEYACRAGAKTAYSFGDDPGKLNQYAWYYSEEDPTYTYHLPRRKKPNAWGVYDMHGNVAEWVLDGYDPRRRAALNDGVLNPWIVPLKRYPRIVKGGSWDHEADELRVTARDRSTPDWKGSEAQAPKSVWYHTDAQHVGFRIVRPLKTPSAEEMHLFWNSDDWSVERNLEDL